MSPPARHIGPRIHTYETCRCVFGEMLVGKPILSGESDSNQLDIIFDLCGTPTDENMPGWRQLPGAEAIKPKQRLGNLNSRFNR